MNNHPEFPHLSVEAGRIQALLEYWNRADVAAFASAEEFAEAFYVAEFADDPAADGRDDDLDTDEILERACQHWQACRAEAESLRQLNELFPVRDELSRRWSNADEQYALACHRHAPIAEIRELRTAAKAAELAVVEFDEEHPEVIAALNRFVANQHA